MLHGLIGLAMRSERLQNGEPRLKKTLVRCHCLTRGIPLSLIQLSAALKTSEFSSTSGTQGRKPRDKFLVFFVGDALLLGREDTACFTRATAKADAFVMRRGCVVLAAA